MIVLKNGFINIDNALVARDVAIENDKIVAIGSDLDATSAEVIDVKGGYITAGAVDVHVHLREPGFTKKETVASGTKSAASGGVTTIMAMPNTMPATDSVVHLSTINEIIERDAVVKVYPFCSVTKGLKGAELTDMAHIAPTVKGFSDDGVCVNDGTLLKDAMAIAKAYNKVIASHLECEGYGTTPEAEILACKKELVLAKETGVKYHLCHLSTTQCVSMLKEAVANGVDVTAEVTPHHLFLTEEEIVSPNFKMNPPLRSNKDREAVLNALLDGSITIVATDHAPHTEEEKSREYNLCPNGIIGLETLFPLIYTNLVRTGKATLNQMEAWLTTNPAERFGLPSGKVAVGATADIAVLDINNSRIYNKNNIVSSGKNSPFIGAELYGFAVLTLVDGKVVYNNLHGGLR
ncbi:MAG: dihydroorotase [Bacillota bacterium]